MVKSAAGRGGGRRAIRARCVSGATARTRKKAAAALAQVAIAAATAACACSGTSRRCRQRRWFRLYRCCTRGAKPEMQMLSRFAVGKPCRPHGGVLLCNSPNSLQRRSRGLRCLCRHVMRRAEPASTWEPRGRLWRHYWPVLLPARLRAPPLRTKNRE